MATGGMWNGDDNMERGRFLGHTIVNEGSRDANETEISASWMGGEMCRAASASGQRF